MPKIFLQAVIRDSDTYRVVIDGQQRIKAILDFLYDRYSLDKPYSGEFVGRKFSELPKAIQDEFLSYKLDVNEIRNAPDDIVRDIYSRVNKYTVALNRQELRRADFPGEFLKLSEELATEQFFEDAKVFTAANSKRMQDVEFVSELLAELINGPQEKRDYLDQIYSAYMEWDGQHKEGIKSRFIAVLVDMKTLFNTDKIALFKNRFRQRADFYSLFACIDDLLVSGHSLNGKPLEALQEDLYIMDFHTAPESEVKLFSHYAVQCVSQANSSASRAWRRDFLKLFLQGTYIQKPPNSDGVKSFHEILADIHHVGSDVCPPYSETCPICEDDITDYDPKNVFLTWSRASQTFQLSNAVFIHNSCKQSCREDYFIDLIQSDTTPELPL